MSEAAASSVSTDAPFVAPGATVRGDVRLGERSSIWFSAVVEADGAPVVIEPEANVQDNCEVRSAPGFPARVGSGTSLGHNARVIGADVGVNCLIAMGATVLEGAVVEDGSLIAAKAIVPAGMRVPAGSLVMGHGQVRRPVSDAEYQRILGGGRAYVQLGREYLRSLD